MICALRLAKPTISIGYAAKNEAQMAAAGLSGFCHSIGSLDVDQLIGQFTQMQGRARAVEMRQVMTERNAENARLLDQQFAEISAALFPQARTGYRAARPSTPADAC